MRQAIQTVKPGKIAVAFVGDGWKSYVNINDLKEIIVSPSLGSNPFAIEALMKALGQANVYFLDRLHSKLYIGEEYVFLGSPNLSGNGFGNQRNIESGVLLQLGEDGNEQFNKGCRRYENPGITTVVFQ